MVHTDIPPHNIEVEQAVIGAILIDGKLSHGITPDDFYLGDHKRIAEAILDLHDLGEPIDLPAIAARNNEIVVTLKNIAINAITSANIKYHLDILKNLSIIRSIYSFVLSLSSSFKSYNNSNPHASETEELINSIQSFAKSLDYKSENHKESGITEAVRRYVSTTEGDFTATDCDKVLQSTTSTTKYDRATKYDNKHLKSVRRCLQRMRKDGEIRLAGKKEGVYRRVDDKAEIIEWWNASAEPLDIKYPMGIEEYVLTLPKNIVVVSGEPNSGKTGFLLNFAARNILDKDRTIDYFSSEMGDRELKSRLSKFEKFPAEQWRKVRFRERSGNFADVIDPNGISIIDFLEVTTDFWMVASYMKDIHDKLNNGICIVALQKNKGTDFGLGGQRGLEKPRLYITLGQDDKKRNICKIVKGKNWAKEDVNPNGLQIEFKLIQGYKFMSQTPWHKEGEL